MDISDASSNAFAARSDVFPRHCDSQVAVAHAVVMLQDKRLAWYDLDLSTKPYRALRYHQHALQSVAFHKKYPLFASASDDASVHIFHGMVYQVQSELH